MSDKNKPQTTENPNEWISWIEESISKKHIKYYDYKHFRNVQKIDAGGFGKIYRANRKNLEEYFALKSLFNPDNTAVKEIVHEVITIIILCTHLGLFNINISCLYL